MFPVRLRHFARGFQNSWLHISNIILPRVCPVIIERGWAAGKTYQRLGQEILKAMINVALSQLNDEYSLSTASIRKEPT